MERRASEVGGHADHRVNPHPHGGPSQQTHVLMVIASVWLYLNACPSIFACAPQPRLQLNFPLPKLLGLEHGSRGSDRVPDEHHRSANERGAPAMTF